MGRAPVHWKPAAIAPAPPRRCRLAREARDRYCPADPESGRGARIGGSASREPVQHALASRSHHAPPHDSIARPRRGPLRRAPHLIRRGAEPRDATAAPRSRARGRSGGPRVLVLADQLPALAHLAGLLDGALLQLGHLRPLLRRRHGGAHAPRRAPQPRRRPRGRARAGQLGARGPRRPGRLLRGGAGRHDARGHELPRPLDRQPEQLAPDRRRPLHAARGRPRGRLRERARPHGERAAGDHAAPLRADPPRDDGAGPGLRRLRTAAPVRTGCGRPDAGHAARRQPGGAPDRHERRGLGPHRPRGRGDHRLDHAPLGRRRDGQSHGRPARRGRDPGRLAAGAPDRGAHGRPARGLPAPGDVGPRALRPGRP